MTTISCFPAQWDVRAKTWRRYYVEPGTDWWAEHYPADQMQRPTGPLCDGCHSVNYDVKAKTVTEWNVGCEKCHGAGSLHVQFPVAATIVNPAKLQGERADDVCLQCHSQGQPRTKPLEGVYYDWPVGYQPGDRLSDVWMLEEHHLGKESFTHWPDGNAHKNRMQGNDYVQSQMSVKGVRCYALPRCPRHAERGGAAPARRRGLPAVPRPPASARPAGHDRAPHSTSAGQRGQQVRRLPHAGHRADHWHRQRPKPHLQVHLAGRDETARRAQPVHVVPYRSIQRLGHRRPEEMAERLTVAGR